MLQILLLDAAHLQEEAATANRYGYSKHKPALPLYTVADADGNRRLLEDLGIDSGVLTARAESMRSDGQTVMFVAVDGRLAGLIAVADPIKATTPTAIEALHAEGIRIVMLTGDTRSTAEAVAR